MLFEYLTAFGEFIKARARELSSKIGAILAAAAGAAVAANALDAPWNYVAFAAAIGLVLFPEPKR